MSKLNLKQAREQAGLTQERVAKQVGTTLAVVKGWEDGKGSPKMEQGMYLALLYGLKIGNMDFSLEAQMEG